MIHLRNMLKKIKIIYYPVLLCYCLKRNGFRIMLHMIEQKLTGKKDVVYRKRKLQIEKVEENIKFSILVPLYNTNLEHLVQMIDSVCGQTYSNWELCLADASDILREDICKICQEKVKYDSRIHYIPLEKNQGIAANTNQCAAHATGEFIVLCDHDDVLDKYALQLNALTIKETGAEVLYSDEDHLDEDGKYTAPLYKPDWSIDLLYSQMYVCHLFVFKKSLFDRIGGFNSSFDGSQDYDLMLRFSEHTDKICHIPCILYSWRETKTSTATHAEVKPYALDAGRRALDSHLKRKYGNIAHAEKSKYMFVYEARFDTLKNKPLVSIIIPMKDKWNLTRKCVQSILKNTSYTNYEILILDNRSEKRITHRWLNKIQTQNSRISVVKADFEFNWSKLNNFGMKHANGEVYIFLNNDTLVISKDWIERLCENAMREDVGVVGPMLLYKDKTIQHAGVVVGMGGWADHVFKSEIPRHIGTPFISPMVNRNVLAVTGACLAVSKRTVEKIGGFDERFIICGSDVEFCLRAYRYGLNNLYNSNVQLFHLESKSRSSYIPEVDFQMSAECYGTYRSCGDPFYNINMDINRPNPTISDGDILSWDKIKRHFVNNRF